MTADSAAIRPGEELDLSRLRNYLRGRLDGVEDGIVLEQFPGGHSNLTYLLKVGKVKTVGKETAGKEYVLRRPPLGPVAPRAHDMVREYRILDAISPHFPAAPKVYLACEDAEVIGAKFYIMERRHGLVLRREVPPACRGIADLPRRASQAFTDCLAQLHSIDIFHHGLDSLGRPEGFLERQVRGWTGRWERAKTSDLPEMERLREWLHERLPRSQTATIVHNDYKLDNMMLDAEDPGRVTAVLDWEMTSVGDPLIDVGIVMCYWVQADDPEARKEAISALTTHPGWYTREELLTRYEAATGYDLSNIAYYEVYGLFKLAVVLQQIYYRFHAGQTQDTRFREFDKRVKGLAEAGVLAMERR